MKKKSYFVDCTQSNKNVELCLELEMDEGIEEILALSDTCCSTLLDVAVIKPNELEGFGNVNKSTLKANEVRKLIASLAKQKRERYKYFSNLVKESLKFDDPIIQVSKHAYDSNFDKMFVNGVKKKISNEQLNSTLFSKNVNVLSELVNLTKPVHPLFNKIKKSLKNVESEITNMQHINLVLNSNKILNTDSSEEFRLYKQQVAEEVIQNNYLTTKEIYKTANNFQDFKPLIIQPLNRIENQKGQIFSKNFISPNVNSSINDYFYQNFYLHNINERIKKLEERITLQEEKPFPCDYFKQMITKIVSYISPKLFNLHADDKKIISEAATFLNTYKETIAKAEEANKKHRVNIFGDSNTSITTKIKKMYEQKMNQTIRNISKSPETPRMTPKSIQKKFENSLKWSKKILKPNEDLKTKMGLLINENLHAISTKPHSAHKNYENKFTMCCNTQNKYSGKEFINHVKNNVIKSEILQQSKASGDDKIIQTFKSKACFCKQTESDCKNVNVAYMNPKIDVWRKSSQSGTNEDSTNSGRSERKSINEKILAPKLNDLGKQEFINILSKTKNRDKKLLWKNIWTQAQASGLTKEDLITIKVPNQGQSNETFESELVIKEIEEILLVKAAKQ